MKVILTQDVLKIGKKDDVLEFKEGFAQNVLLSKGKAILATPQALAQLASKKASQEKKREDEMKLFESLIASINNTKLEIKAKTNEKGHLFKSIGPRDIVQAVKGMTGTDIDESAVNMKPIKEIGTYNVEIKKANKKGNCEVIVSKA